MLTTRPLGLTGIEVTLLGFGGVPLMEVSPSEAERVLERALSKGINYFDTARAYGDSEAKMGQVLSAVRDQVFISTKGIRRSSDETWEDIHTSLRQLRTDYIDVYFIHDVSREADSERILAPEGALAAAQRAKREGLIHHVGVSGHRPNLLLRLIETGAFEVVMVATNIADLDFQRTVIPRANELNLGIVAMKPFAGGALANAAVALRYSLVQPISTAIPGMRSIEEVDENVAIAEDWGRVLTEEERQALEEEARSLGTRFCRQCGYCLPCTAGIDIPRVFLLDRHYTRYNLKDVAQADYAELDVCAAECIECGDCEERCPYELPIIEMLREAHALLA